MVAAGRRVLMASAANPNRSFARVLLTLVAVSCAWPGHFTRQAATRPLVPSLEDIQFSAGGPQTITDAAALAFTYSLQQTSGGHRPSTAGNAAIDSDAVSEGTVDTGAEPTLSSAMWSYPGPDSFKLRGRNYLRDKKKVGCMKAVLCVLRICTSVCVVASVRSLDSVP